MGRHYQRGLVLFELKRFREAAAEFTAELGEWPDCPSSHGMLGACLANLCELQAAEESCGRAIALAPDSYYAYYVLGLIRLAQREPGNAERLFREAARLELAPNVLCEIAKLEHASHLFEACLNTVSIVLQRDPHYAEALVIVSKCLASMGHSADAKKVLLDGLSHDAENPTLHRALGDVALKAGDLSEAVGHLVEARRISPIEHNDRSLLAAAYGRYCFPINHISNLLLWMQNLSITRRWTIVTVLASIIFVFQVAPFHSPFKSVVIGTIVTGFMNIVVLPVTFDGWSKVVGMFAARRSLGLRFQDYLQLFAEGIGCLIVHTAFTAFGVLMGFGGKAGVWAVSGVVLYWDFVSIPWLPAPWNKPHLLLRLLIAVPLLIYVLCAAPFLWIAFIRVDHPYSAPVFWLVCLAISYFWMRVHVHRAKSRTHRLASFVARSPVNSTHVTTP